MPHRNPTKFFFLILWRGTKCIPSMFEWGRRHSTRTGQVILWMHMAWDWGRRFSTSSRTSQPNIMSFTLTLRPTYKCFGVHTRAMCIWCAVFISTILYLLLKDVTNTFYLYRIQAECRYRYDYTIQYLYIYITRKSELFPYSGARFKTKTGYHIIYILRLSRGGVVKRSCWHDWVWRSSGVLLYDVGGSNVLGARQ